MLDETRIKKLKTKWKVKSFGDEDKLEICQWIKENHQALEVDGVMVDATSANLIVTIAGKLNPQNREKFLGLDMARMGNIAWKLVQ